MSIFNENLDKTLKSMIPEWLEPAIDHHMENGITGESFDEITRAMYQHYKVEFKQYLQSITKFLQQVGYSETPDDEYRSKEEQDLLTQLSNLRVRIEYTFKEHMWAIRAKNNKGHASGLLDFRGIVNAATGKLKQIQNIAIDVTTKLNNKSYRIPPQLVKGFSTSIANIISDFKKVDQYLSLDAEGNSVNFNTIELLTTPEARWLPHLSPKEVSRILEIAPDHGAKESTAKIQKIMNYGPDHQLAGETLQLIASIWKVTAGQIVKVAAQYGEELDMIQWLAEEGPRYGIDISDLPPMPGPEAPEEEMETQAP